MSYVPVNWDSAGSNTPRSCKILPAENPKYIPEIHDSLASYVLGSHFLFLWTFKPMQQPLKKHSHSKNCLIVALNIQIHFIYVLQNFLGQELLVDSPVSQALGSCFESPITPWEIKKNQNGPRTYLMGPGRAVWGKNQIKNLVRLSLETNEYLHME